MPASQIVPDCCERVQLARQLGFDDVAAGQHFLAQPYQMLQLVPLLSRIAAEAGEPRNTGVWPARCGPDPSVADLSPGVRPLNQALLRRRGTSLG